MNAALLILWALAPAPADDVVRKALTDEMARTLKELQIPDEPHPYQVVYIVSDLEQVSGAATFGAPMAVNGGRLRNLRVEVRVGDRTFDSGNFSDPSSASFFPAAPAALPLDDDYLALRQELWQRTDEAFKRALGAIASKRAAEKAQAKNEEDAPFDLAEVKPAEATWASDGANQPPDRGAFAKVLTRLSAVFRDTPAIHSSVVGGEHVVIRQRLLTSEGSWKDERRSFVEVVARAETQAEDGMVLRSSTPFRATTLAGLPPLEAMEKTLKAMATELGAARKAPIGENGTAVVLFEGEAAAQLMRRLLGDPVSGTPPPRSPSGRGSAPTSDLTSKLKQRIAPLFFEAYDDPREALGPGKAPLFGAYQIDDEGVPAERVNLVQKGVLESLLMSRTPRKEITRSNGHGRGRATSGAVRADIGVLHVSGGPAALADPALRARALKEAKAEGNAPVYIVRAADFSGGSAVVVHPRVLVRLRDGKEEPVRGVRFQNLLPRSLKDIVAVGKQPAAYNSLESGEGPVGFGGSPTTVITPSILLKDVEVKKDTDKHPRPPLYPHPSFAEK
jgi:TldD protein